MGYWSNVYSRMDRLLKRLPFVNPDRLSQLGLLLSIICFCLYQTPWFTAMLFLVLLLDYLDGVMARRIKKKDEHIDIACDRASELIIFYPLGIWFMLLVVANIWLSIYKFVKKVEMPIILPLRHLLLVYMLVRTWLPI